MLSYSEIKKGVKIIFQGEPYEIIEADLLFKGRGHSVLQAKIKNLFNGNIVSKTFHPSDSFEEPEISKIRAEFLYSHRDQYFFSEENNPKNRFSLSFLQIGNQSQFLKPKQKVEALIFNGQIINVSLPIKIELKVSEAPPGIKAGRSEAGYKQVTLESGAKINVPLFIEEGDVIEVNTENGEYVRRVAKIPN